MDNPSNQSPTASSPRITPASRIRHTLWTLVFASMVCTGMLAVRMAATHALRFSGLFGNLLLAWIPMVLSLLIWRKPQGRRAWFWGLMVVWFLFFPNAFYIATDLIHMKKFGMDGVFRWFDMLMTTSFACAGIFLGTLSLYLIHLLVRERFGWRVGWGFAAAMLALGSFGIYLGRALRLNSWDVVARPLKLVADISSLVEPTSAKEVSAFSLTLFFFSLAVYVFVVSMARLHETDTLRFTRAKASQEIP